MRKRLYLDSNIFIYSVERYHGLDEILTRLQEDIASGKVDAYTSELTLSEVLVKPIADQDKRRIALYNNSLKSAGHFWVMPVDRAILIKAAEVRAIHKLKLPDAIHYATASLHQCTHLITNDIHFKTIGDLKILTPYQLSHLE